MVCYDSDKRTEHMIPRIRINMVSKYYKYYWYMCVCNWVSIHPSIHAYLIQVYILT